MTAFLISHEDCLKHVMPDGHPECPERISAISNQLVSTGLDFCLIHKEAVEASRNHLQLVHSPQYLDRVEFYAPKEGEELVNFDEDIWLGPYTLRAAKLAAGAVVQGVDYVMRNETDTVFCNVRPPGHHAEHNRAMGFCLYNNAAVGAAYALHHYRLKRVAIVDFDVHHGNGTQDIFLDENRVLYFSSFQYPFYPNTEINPGKQNIVNAPLPATCESEQFREVILQKCIPALKEFAPELLIISAGFDAHVLDDMSSICLMDNDYLWVSEQLREFVDSSEECQGIVSVLEGGYDLGSLSRSACAHIKALAKL
ncbi:histone deacetylase family protein [Teredinibacter sp. KSP-S5-2]|uniref:histone deacetylase family protein n=1 Tax=Teredinibacter sp. KSP-S5-2 TaxID=3034506 RepID=UPI0029347C12|nr:histone deacetylase family protein [Teredinibacter sp. KSP-S5-2]WNO08655.1 histone deacetylase family protein [Teredinibacter sp. KSP-S5-2]